MVQLPIANWTVCYSWFFPPAIVFNQTQGYFSGRSEAVTAKLERSVLAVGLTLGLIFLSHPILTFLRLTGWVWQSLSLSVFLLSLYLFLSFFYSSLCLDLLLHLFLDRASSLLVVNGRTGKAINDGTFLCYMFYFLCLYVHIRWRRRRRRKRTSRREDKVDYWTSYSLVLPVSLVKCLLRVISVIITR